MSVKMRQLVERKIARRFISSALAAGYAITVNDGEKETLKESTRLSDILGAMFTTDEDRLLAYKDGKCVGWVLFIYGNDGWDAISDYTVNLEPIVAPANKLAGRYS